MELITILSTIILIATISTFILSVGAYILYKIRSRSEISPILNTAGPTKAELVTVPELEDYEILREKVGRTIPTRTNSVIAERDMGKTDRRINNITERLKKENALSPKFIKYNAEGYSSFDKENSTGDLQWK